MQGTRWAEGLNPLQRSYNLSQLGNAFSDWNEDNMNQNSLKSEFLKIVVWTNKTIICLTLPFSSNIRQVRVQKKKKN